MKKEKRSITIGWLYPDLMSTYGDRGNIIVLTKRCEWRKIAVKVVPISIETDKKLLKECDLLFMGGAQDRQQEIVNDDLQKQKGAILTSAIEDNIPGLYVCGAYQFLGKYYKTADGTKLAGLGVFDIHTIHPGDNSERLIGNIMIKPNEIILGETQKDLSSPTRSGIHIDSHFHGNDNVFVGFENHGGRTYLGKSVEPFGKVIKGFGNNGEDGTEGMIYKNSIGTYLHGPILPKNPDLADWLITKALEKKYDTNVELEELPAILEKNASKHIVNKI